MKSKYPKWFTWVDVRVSSFNKPQLGSCMIVLLKAIAYTEKLNPEN